MCEKKKKTKQNEESNLGDEVILPVHPECVCVCVQLATFMCIHVCVSPSVCVVGELIQ